jgi:Lrp/AsnC family transcriptional regulator for asnA, asnC and gidA
VTSETPRRKDSRDTLPLLDETDREILRILQRDGRTPNVEIARQVGVTETTVRNRIGAMRNRGYIDIVAIPTPRIAGLNVSAIIGMTVQPAHQREVARTLTERSEVRFVGLGAGRFNVIIETFFRDNEHFLEFTSQTLAGMPAITAVESTLILQTEKFSYDWV